VVGGSAWTRHTFDESALDHATGEGAKGLVALKRELGQVVQRSSRVLVEVSESVPLHEAYPERHQFGVYGPVVSDLQPLHREPDLAQWSCHEPSLAEVLQLAYINMLR